MKEFITTHKFKLLVIINVLVLGIGGVSAAIILSSDEVSYDNTTSGMSSNNVQDAIDELYGVARLSERMDELEEELSTTKTQLNDYWKTVYPVGSIYISINSANPSTKFGGTWTSYGSGRTLVGVNTSDTSFDTVEETGGGKTASYTPAGSIGGTTLSTDQIPSHRHSIPVLSGSTTAKDNVGQARSAGAHSHRVVGGNNGSTNLESAMGGLNSTSGERWAAWFGGGYNASDNVYAASAGAHTHTLNIPSLSVTTTANNTGYLGGGKSHNHSFTGTNASISTVQPYITVYMWKRTA